MSMLNDCGHPGPHGTAPDGSTYCYACCALRDVEQMTRDGRTMLYLCKNDTGKYGLTNWPGSLRFPVRHVRKGKHNIAGSRYDAWFCDSAGREWHAVQYGEWTQVAHCRRLRA